MPTEHTSNAACPTLVENATSISQLYCSIDTRAATFSFLFLFLFDTRQDPFRQYVEGGYALAELVVRRGEPGFEHFQALAVFSVCR